jgi:hypothetical protein
VRQGRGRRLSAWLAAGDRALPYGLRWGLFAFGLVALGGTYAATGSEAAQVLVLFALAFGIYPAMTRAFGRSDALTELARDRTAPVGVVARSLLFFVLWAALIFVAAPDLGLGPWFWWWVVMWPWLEVYIYLAERRLRRDGGGSSWKPIRPLRDTVVAGLATAPVIAVIALFEGLGVGEALLTGFLCGCIVFLIAGAFTGMSHRAGDAGESGLS